MSRITIIEKKDFTVSRDETTNELYVTLNNMDFQQYRLGVKQNKNPRVFMNTEPLRQLQDILQTETKPFFIGNEKSGFAKTKPFMAQGSVTNLGIFQ